MKKLSFVLSLFVLPVCLGATTEAIDAAVGRGMAYLVAQQQADGHFSDSNTPALTALPLWAMTLTGKGGPDAAKRAVSFILAQQQADGGFYARRAGGSGTGGPGGLSTYNTSVCLTALYESGLASNESLLKARTFLSRCQLTGDDAMAGGFGYGQAMGRRRHADLSNTAYAMDAMRRTEKLEEFRSGAASRADLDWDQALAFVMRLQETEGAKKGGAAYDMRTPQAGTATNAQGRVRLMAYGSMSYAAVMSMAHARLTKGDPRVRNALGFCARYWTVDENPGMGSQGLYYYFDILSRALVAADVAELKAEDGRRIAWREELAAKLLALQRPDGSWANANNRFWEGDPVLATSFSVLALTLCR